MSGWASAITAIAAVAGAATSAYNGNKQRKAAREAAKEQERMAQEQLAREEEAQNKANGKEADISSLLNAGDSTGSMGTTTTLSGNTGVQTTNALGMNNKLGS